ncbi:MAG: 4Fe-4S binding protein [Spirochaetaceae bacterium]|nr:4Fe-4S binding protein [Spirochaetaceae bacterium]
MEKQMTKKLLLLFKKSEIEKPIVYHLVKDYDLIINIFRAKITPDEYGYLALDVNGKEENIKKALKFLKSENIEINETDKGIRWNKNACIQCGNCLSHCPTDALFIADRKSRRVEYDIEKCVQCLSCTENCPFGACQSIYFK